jgi:4-amino-4-deoxy-L-arabinose transferase-like glycosyltransferase
MIFFKKPILLIAILCVSGFILRAFFLLFIAESYYGTPDFYVNGDTSAWEAAIINLIEKGTFTVDEKNEYGYFARMPGYSFFIGIFYMLSNKSTDGIYQLIIWVQIFIDVFNIFLIYQIGKNIFRKYTGALILALLYAIYPFVIIWTSIAMSETLSIFFLFSSIYFLTSQNKYRNIYSGLLVGIGVLFRPQLIFLIPFFLLYIYINNRKASKQFIIQSFFLVLAVTLTYGIWPIRNYWNHGKIILMQDLRGLNNWSPDVIAFMQYTYSVKAEWEPQFSSIIHNEKVEYPAIAYSSKEDSLKLGKAISLSKNCGFGFSHWGGYWKSEVAADSSCTPEIAALFDELRKRQMKENPLNFYLWVPLQNLQKAFFKFSLNGPSSVTKKLASLLFILRTAFIFLGLYALIMELRNRRHVAIMLLILFYFIMVYMYLCFGTQPQCRNIEIRYFLQADVLLLIPFSILVYKWISKPFRLEEIENLT